MTVDTSFVILVIFLSVALAVFLTLAIILTYKLIKISDTVQRITDKAEDIADKAESVADFVQKSTAPLAFGQILSNILGAVNKHNKGKRE